MLQNPNTRYLLYVHTNRRGLRGSARGSRSHGNCVQSCGGSQITGVTTAARIAAAAPGET